MIREVVQTEAPVTPAQLDQVESRIGTKLPTEYREWILKHNGGRPVPAGFKFKNATGPYTASRVAWFYAVHSGNYENFELEFRRMKLLGRRLPDDLMAIGRDDGGNKVCMAYSGSNKGKVYFWGHEEEGPDPSYHNCRLIADSFQEFLDGLSD